MTEQLFATALFRCCAITTNTFGEKAYLIQDLKSLGLILIDPGDAYELIEDKISQWGGNLQRILLTHGHFDHIVSCDQLSQKYQMDCWIHSGDQKLLKRSELFSIRLSKKIVKSPSRVSFFDAPSTLEWGDKKITVIPCPGHTAGGVVLCFEGFAFTGDSLFFERIGPTNYSESNLEVLKNSIHSLLPQIPAGTLILPGHGRNWYSEDAKSWWSQHFENPPQFHIMKSNQST